MIRRTMTLIQFSPFIVSSIKMTVQLTLEQEKKLKEYLKEKTLSWQVKKRLESIRLLHNGVSPSLIAKQLAIRSQVIYEYVKAFKEGGFNQLIKMEKPGQESKLTEEMLENLEQYIKNKEKYGKKMTREEKSAWLLTTYNICISSEWLSQRLSSRAIAKKEAPWR